MNLIQLLENGILKSSVVFSHSSLPELQKDRSGMKQAQLEKGDSISQVDTFLCLGFLCLTFPGGGSCVETIGLRWPNVSSSLWSLVLLVRHKLSGDSAQLAQRQLVKVLSAMAQFLSPLDVKRTEGLGTSQTAGSMTNCHKVEAGAG